MSSGNRKNIDDFISKIKSQQRDKIDINDLFERITKGDKAALSKGITLVESTKSEDIPIAHQLLEKCLPFRKDTKRIAITGIPGVGKSTFINSFAYQLAISEKKVAVLSVDPSSSISKGSILGDKTRMEDIAHLEQVYIRPTATGNTLGGVHLKTREVILLCEAAGYDHILVETVGVGQSEYLVQSMTDIMIVMLLPGSGDSLQGIKRGIMEMADIILINKADQFPEANINQTVSDYKHAMHLLSAKPNQWTVQVLGSSAFDKDSIQSVIASVEQYFNHIILNGFFDNQRLQQWQEWFASSIGWATTEVLKTKGIDLSKEVLNENELPPAKALNAIKKLLH
ncbi:MAG: methylmalonyl Co-A mutase-associated GTPase MeaB [Chitinophagales bacterium]